MTINDGGMTCVHHGVSNLISGKNFPHALVSSHPLYMEMRLARQPLPPMAAAIARLITEIAFCSSTPMMKAQGDDMSQILEILL